MIWNVFDLAFLSHSPNQLPLVGFLMCHWLVRLCSYLCTCTVCMQVVLCLFGAHMSIHLSVNTVFVLSCASDSKDDEKLLCICENDKGTCVNGTCQGDICFYTWVHGREEKGCFAKVNYREQCFTSFDRFYVECCTQNQCNAFSTAPPNISQYPKPLLYIYKSLRTTVVLSLLV